MSDENAPAMDYDAHERTYEGFINFSKVGTIAVLNIVLCLILFGFGGTAAFVFGWLMLIATFVASAIGLAIGDTPAPPPPTTTNHTHALALALAHAHAHARAHVCVHVHVRVRVHAHAHVHVYGLNPDLCVHVMHSHQK
ncbi:MAG: aa3-type cytochrome c oxidase subunit IV [Rhodobacteraceae bacterium]|nr:aa3-type cytochrome c oxidase subunit IV [Paracoccaceae bacterium]